MKTAELKGEGGVKAIGIVGSPRRGGSTDVLVEQVLAGARAHGLETEKVYLGELDIRPCRACYSCAATGRCVIEDDFPWLLEKVLGSVGIVLGSPMYVGTVTALMKAFIDRVDCSQVEMVRAPTWPSCAIASGCWGRVSGIWGRNRWMRCSRGGLRTWAMWKDGRNLSSGHFEPGRNWPAP